MFQWILLRTTRDGGEADIFFKEEHQQQYWRTTATGQYLNCYTNTHPRAHVKQRKTDALSTLNIYIFFSSKQQRHVKITGKNGDSEEQSNGKKKKTASDIRRIAPQFTCYTTTIKLFEFNSAGLRRNSNSIVIRGNGGSCIAATTAAAAAAEDCGSRYDEKTATKQKGAAKYRPRRSYINQQAAVSSSNSQYSSSIDDDGGRRCILLVYQLSGQPFIIFLFSL